LILALACLIEATVTLEKTLRTAPDEVITADKTIA
jgi:hypothetical protein